MKKRDSLNLFEKLEQKGETHRHNNNVIFFGNESFKEIHFPKQAQFLHQIHGNLIIEASSKKHKADGHFSNDKQKPLFIQAADCLPVFISQKETITAIHIGWRGLMKRIFTEATKKLESIKDAKIFIGPHIHKPSFQLNKEFTKNLLQPHDLDIETAIKLNLLTQSLDKRDHYYIDLKEILKREINSIEKVDIQESPTNTYTSPIHYSHRRNPWRTGRNFSFIMKT